MFKSFFISELKYVLRQPTIYIYILIFAILEFFTLAIQNLAAADAVYRNAPFIITRQMLQLTFLGLLITFNFLNNAAIRDYKNDFNEILFTTSLRKSGYFFGRFFAAVLLSTLPFIGAYIGLLFGSWMAPIFGWVDAERFGPFYIQTFINTYFLFILPNAFIFGSIIFAIASTWKSTMASFMGALFIITVVIVSSTLMSDIGTQTIAGLIDIFGINLYNIETRYYTNLEKNTINPTFSGLIAWNRLLWIGIGTIALSLSYIYFSFQKKNEKQKKLAKQTIKREQSFVLPELQILHTSRTSWLQFKSFFFINFLSIVKSLVFKILLFSCTFILITKLSFGFEVLGLHSYPLTYRIIDVIEGDVNLFLLIILIFFSGELIWRNRALKIYEIIDTTPHISFISIAAKALSLVSVVSILHLAFVGIGILYQLLNGFNRIEIDVYVLDFLYDNFPQYIIYGGIMTLIQVFLNNKYIGYFVSILILFVSGLILNALGISTNMLHIAGGPSIQYSDLNSFGPGLTGALWFNTYWVLFSIICLFIADSLWNRGAKKTLLKRIMSAKKQVPKSYRSSVVILIGIWMAVGGYVYYNTQILNPYFSNDAGEQLQVNYEKKYKKYQDIAVPKITEVEYFIDIYPSQRNVDAKATITLTNEGQIAIDTLHFILNDEWDMELTVPNSSLVSEDKTSMYYIYKLENPLQPGAAVKVTLDAKYTTKGFQNDRGNTNIVENGTMLNYGSFLPGIGYDSDLELRNNSIRKEYGLPIKKQVPELNKGITDSHMQNTLSKGTSDFIDVETIISTSIDQTAIAPGSLLKQWKKENRNYYHYKTDTPSLNFHTFNSGRYKIAKRQWNGIEIAVYHHEKHDDNINMMLNAAERALKYYTKHFGPYYHKQCRIIEVPRYVRFGGKAFPGTMLYNESAGFVMNLEDETKLNIIDAVIAHEIGHQWWAHQVIGANMQGNSMLSESLAEYSTLMTLKETYKNPMKIREFSEYDHDMYLRGRSRERVKESPLYKVENQSYIQYGKGSIVLYALQDYIGEEKVNMALKNFLEAYRYKKPPYPSSLDFLKYLEPQVPDSLKYLVEDSFKDIILYDNILKSATYKQLDNGKYSVVLDIESYKIKADSLGNETNVTMNDWIDIGFFLDNDEEQLYHQKRVKINKESTTLTFELDTVPVKAAIDPRHIFIDKQYEDNIRTISERENE